MIARRTLLMGGSALAGLGALGLSACARDPDDGLPPDDATLIGMAGHPWAARLAETGPVQARRSFGPDVDSGRRLIRAAEQDKTEGRTSVLSIKVPSWEGAARGAWDARLTALADRLDALSHDVYLAVHHEPAGDGLSHRYAAMQAHVLPLLKRPHVKVCVIVNGYWYSHLPERKPLTDAQRAEWLPEAVLASCDVVAADCYHGGTPDDPGGEPDEQMIGLLEWSERVGHGKPLGLGEFSGHTANAINNVGRLLREEPGAFSWACIYNSNRNNRAGVQWALTGERLAAFRALLPDPDG